MKNIIYFRDRNDKLENIVKSFPYFFEEGKILDVGCGNAYLRKLIKAEYTGVDKEKNADLSIDISSGLPFKDKSFDTVVAFDVLEHIDDIYFIFDEVCRVSRRWVIITLPNLYEWRLRLSFLFGRLKTGKYGLPEEPPQDRHRWIFNIKEAEKFVYKRAEKNNFKIFQKVTCYYRYNRLFPKMITRIGILLGNKFRNLFASHCLIILERKDKSL